jgi:glucosamine kinase
MILVADSGSTKCDWALIDGSEIVIKLKTIGFNPTFHTSEFIFEHLANEFDIKTIPTIHTIYFFGAGCSNDSGKQIVKKGLERLFINAEIFVKHDLEGSAIATCGDKPGISCILGTGSNACLWNGKDIIETPFVFGNGYVLGDEGSGTHLGKTLLKYYFYNKLPQDLRNNFESKYGKRAQIFQNVYQNAAPNVYLASLSYFIFEQLHHPLMKEIVNHVFQEFVDSTIKRYQDYKILNIGFVGSIANVFEKELRNICELNKIKVGNIIKEPIDALVKFYSNRQ